MRYYTCANTSDGLVDFTEENIFDIETKIELKGGNERVRDYILNQISGEETEDIIEVGYKDLKSGLIFRDKGIAIVKSCQNPTETINIDDYFDKPKQSTDTEQLYQSMLRAYGGAKTIHDEWERVYICNMDFERLNKYSNSVIERLVQGTSCMGGGKTYKRFFGTSTVDGPVNYIDDLTDSLSKRCFIKGRPGTGKSTFLKKLSGVLKDRNYDVEEYYCSFDKSSLDMVVSRELSFCVFDSTAPHEKFPSKVSDEILDFYINAGLEGTDEKYKKELRDIKNSYNAKIREGMGYFKSVWEIKEASHGQTETQVRDNTLREIVKTILN